MGSHDRAGARNESWTGHPASKITSRSEFASLFSRNLHWDERSEKAKRKAARQLIGTTRQKQKLELRTAVRTNERIGKD
jgi:hypothetical protein